MQFVTLTDCVEARALRDAAAEVDLLVGTIAQGKDWLKSRETKLISSEFGLLTLFTFQKLLQPSGPDMFQWTSFDRQIAFAKKHNLRLYGHALIYNENVAPRWLLQRSWSPLQLESIMRNFIQSTIKRGGEQFYGWVVVNEPFTYRNQPWESAFGREGYIKRAFIFAKEAAPNQKMVLNETYGREGVDSAKAKKVFDLVKKLRREGTPIDVVGIQMHLEISQLRDSYAEEFASFIRKAEVENVDVHITEMDVDQGDGHLGVGSRFKQEDVFARVLSICLDSSRCKVFSVWGTCDYRTWIRTRNNNPHPSSKPLIFDDECRPKPAYFSIQKVIKDAIKLRPSL